MDSGGADTVEAGNSAGSDRSHTGKTGCPAPGRGRQGTDLTALEPRHVTITVERSSQILIDGPDWDELLQRSRFDTIFLRSPFLRAALQAYGDEAEVITIRARTVEGICIGAALFLQQKGPYRVAWHGAI